MVLFDHINEALLADTLTPAYEMSLEHAYQFLRHIRRSPNAPERSALERMAPGEVDETLERHIVNLSYAMRHPGTPQARTAAEFFDSFAKQYERPQRM